MQSNAHTIYNNDYAQKLK